MTWEEIPLRRIFRIVNGGTPTGDEQYWNGDVPWATPIDIGSVDGKYIASTQRHLTEEGVVAGSRTVPSHSLVLSTRAPIGYIAETAKRLAFNQGCRGLIPAIPVDVRYFRYQLYALRDKMVARGAGSTFMELSSEALAGVPVIVPPMAEQCRIANFLDAETARADRVVKAQQLVAALIKERRSRLLDDVLVQQLGHSDPVPSCPLGYFTEYNRPIMYGIVLPGPDVEDGVPIVKGGDVAAGRLSLAQLCKTTREIEAGHVRSRLRTGDLVIAIRGSVGEVAMVPEEISGANLTQDAARIAPGPNVDRGWLELVLQAPTLQAQIKSRVTGATIRGINIWDLRRILVPNITLDVQRKGLKQAETALAVMADLRCAIEHQLAILTERRQALIVAAVTGQIDVTTAGGLVRAGGALT